MVLTGVQASISLFPLSPSVPVSGLKTASSKPIFVKTTPMRTICGCDLADCDQNRRGSARSPQNPMKALNFVKPDTLNSSSAHPETKLAAMMLASTISVEPRLKEQTGVRDGLKIDPGLGGAPYIMRAVRSLTQWRC